MDEAEAKLFPTEVTDRQLEVARLKAHRKIFGSSHVFLHLEDRAHDQKANSVYDIVQDKALKHYERGLNCLSQEEWEEAVLAFSKAITLDPKRVDLYVRRAEAYLQLCDFQSAVLNLQKALSIAAPREEEVALLAFVLYLQGHCLLKQGCYLDALESFTRGSELQPRNSHFAIGSISCLAALGRPAECIRLITQKLEEEKENPDLYVVRARIYQRLNKPSLIYEDVQRALALDPQHTAACALQEKLAKSAEQAKVKAVNHAVQGELEDALSKICFAIENNPAAAKYYIFRGTVYKRMKHFNAAVDDFAFAMQLSDTQNQTYIEAENQLLLTYNDFAVHCYLKGFYNDGVLLLNKAINAETNLKELYINRGDCFYQLGEMPFALADYQQAFEMDGTDWGLRTRIARLHDSLGMQAQQHKQYVEAELQFCNAITAQPLLPELYMHRAHVRRCLQDKPGAQQDAITFILLNPKIEEAASTVMSFFPGKDLNVIISSKLANISRSSLKRSLRDLPMGWMDIPSLVQDDETARLTEPTSRNNRIGLCVTDQQLYEEMIHSHKKINTQIGNVLHRRGQLHSTAPRIGRPPLRKKEQPPASLYNWRTFDLGLVPP